MQPMIPIHDLSINAGNETLFEIFVYNPLTVTTPILTANFKPHRHNFYEVMYLTGGKGVHIIDFETYKYNPPALYLVSPNQIHFWDLSEKLEGYIFLFKEDFLVSSGLGHAHNQIAFFQHMMDSPTFSLDQTQQTKLEPLIKAMVHETSKKEIAQKSVLQAYLHIFLITIQRMYGEKAQSSHVSLVKQFIKIASNTISCNCDLKRCAAKMNISETHLRNTLKEKTGKTPGQIIRQIVILEAKRLLIHSDLSAAEIAYSLHFEDPSYFGRYFKRETGISPTSFRHQNCGQKEKNS